MYFQKQAYFDIRAGTVINVIPINLNKSYLLKINFGSNFGIRNSILRASPHISVDSLVAKHVCAIINFPNYKQGIRVLNTIVLCMLDTKGYSIPIQPDHTIPDGGSLF